MAAAAIPFLFQKESFMGKWQKAQEFLLKYIGAVLLTLNSLLFAIYRSYFWYQLPSQLSQNHQDIVLSRAIIILSWLLLLVLTKTLHYAYIIHSKKRPMKISLKKLEEQYTLFLQVEHNQEQLPHIEGMTRGFVPYSPVSVTRCRFYLHCFRNQYRYRLMTLIPAMQRIRGGYFTD